MAIILPILGLASRSAVSTDSMHSVSVAGYADADCHCMTFVRHCRSGIAPARLVPAPMPGRPNDSFGPILLPGLPLGSKAVVAREHPTTAWVQSRDRRADRWNGWCECELCGW